MLTRYYVPSGKCSPRMLLVFWVCVVVAYPFSWLYAWVSYGVPWIYVVVFAPVIFSLILGALVHFGVDHGHARNPVLMGVLGCLLGTVAWYLQWACWVNFAVHDKAIVAPADLSEISAIGLILHPSWLASAMRRMYHHGAWRFDDFGATGLFAVAAWLLEYVLIVSCPTYLGWYAGRKPYCEGKHLHAEEKELGACLQFIADAPLFVQRAEAELDAVNHLLRRSTVVEPERHARATLYLCGKDEDCFLSVDNISFEWSDGKRTKRVDNVLRYFRISSAVAERMKDKWAK